MVAAPRPAVDPLALTASVRVIREAIGPAPSSRAARPAPAQRHWVLQLLLYRPGCLQQLAGHVRPFSSIIANAFLNHMVVYVMPGEGIEVGQPMTVAEAGTKRPPEFVEVARSRERPAHRVRHDAAGPTLVTYLALTGVAYPLAERDARAARGAVALLKNTCRPAHRPHGSLQPRHRHALGQLRRRAARTTTSTTTRRSST